MERICLKALAKSVAARYTTAKDLAEDLRSSLARLTHQAAIDRPGAEQNLLHMIWESLDANLQDAFALAYNKKKREGSNRISTRDLFQALLKTDDLHMKQVLQALPKDALPEPADRIDVNRYRDFSASAIDEADLDEDVELGASLPPSFEACPTEIGLSGSQPEAHDPSHHAALERFLLREKPLLSDCIADSLEHFKQAGPLARKLSPLDIFVDIGLHGHGPSVAKLREHGVTPDQLEELLQKHDLSVLRRPKSD
jgi:hypothetical protein